MEAGGGRWRVTAPAFARVGSVLPQLQLPKVDVLEIQLKGVEGIQAHGAAPVLALQGSDEVLDTT